MDNEIYDPLIGEHSKATQETLIRENEEKDKQIAALISAKEQAEAASLAMSKALKYNRDLIEASRDPLVTIGPDDIITDVNKATENTTGLPREKLIGTDFSAYFTEPDKAQAGYEKALSEGVVFDYELSLKHISGHTTPVLYNASVYRDDKGLIIGVFAAARDIAFIQNAKNELTYLKNNLELLVKKRVAELVIANKELAFQNEEKEKRSAELIIANKELAFQNEEKEKRSAELIIANKELAFQNEEKDKRAAELVIANKELVFQKEEKADRAAELVIADKELAFEVGEKADRAAELVIANKELVFQNEEKDKRAAELVIANKELTFQKEKIKEFNNQLEYRVTERTAQLESVNKELEALSYSISHDLKAPLRHMEGYVSLLVKKYNDILPKEGRHYFDMISFSAKNMGELIEGLLQFSRSGRIEMNQKLLNMNEIVAALIQPIKEQAIELRIEFNIEPLPLVFGDPDMIKSVWSNLIENAVKFSRKKDLTKISIGAEENENDIVYHIKDNGAGFDMNYASKLFTVFQRLHSREDYEGTGIGLATVQRIIAKHGGKIWAESKVGEGATFYFTLIKRKESESI